MKLGSSKVFSASRMQFRRLARTTAFCLELLWLLLVDLVATLYDLVTTPLRWGAELVAWIWGGCTVHADLLMALSLPIQGGAIAVVSLLNGLMAAQTGTPAALWFFTISVALGLVGLFNVVGYRRLSYQCFIALQVLGPAIVAAFGA